ncbi:MAG: imidazoleglycerol-phosphate dehydratase HisB [Planctomycetota bacterium]
MTDEIYPPRRARVHRETKETSVRVVLDLDGTGEARVSTGVPFLDHMLDALARHGGLDLEVEARGDLEVDDHHTAEDVAIQLGRALGEALGDRSGIVRFGSAYAPLDEALVRAVVDLSGRPWPEVHLEFRREQLGGLATENVVHFMRTLSLEGRFALHLDEIRAENDHHRAEAAFKALALALRAAVARTDSDRVPSTKGVLS